MNVKQILVTGDFVLDNHIYEGRRSHYGDNTSAGVNLKAQLGGAALVHGLLEQLLTVKKKTDRKWRSICGVVDPTPNDEICHVNPSEQAFAFWRPRPIGAASDKQFWRVTEAMGFGPAETNPHCQDMPHKKISDSQEIVVYSEGGMGFRECSDNWCKEILKGVTWIVLKTTSPVAAGSLWDFLTETYSKKLIVIVSAQELRKSPARMNAGLSWEETIGGLLREVGPKGTLAALTRCRHLIVTFEAEGAIWLDLSKGFAKASACLIYESGTIEGEHAHVTKGTAFGYLSCMAAAVTRCLTINADEPNLAAALEGGLAAMRDLREKGHGPANDKPNGFPAKRLADTIKQTSFRYSRAFFGTTAPGTTSAKAPAPEWSLIRQAQLRNGPLYDLARLVLLRGPVALNSLPHLQIGNLLTADRTEIEALRTLAQVIRNYHEKDSGKKPLSIGVFGPPGAGKSFAVKELANNLVGTEGWMEFNLSQFDNPDDLLGAFHQIRDHVLQGHLPVAFFDEFDSRDYKWLQYLLAPMQDGKFQEGQLTHTLGKCILIFAGGTSPTFGTFGPPASLSDGDETDSLRDFRLAKGPDFKSRLDAYLDVLGPNQRKVPHTLKAKGKKPAVEKISGRDFIIDQSDIVFPVRRALMARVQLKCRPDDKLEMDEGLVHALLSVEKYTHGNRSMDKILQPFAAARPAKLHSSLLMPEAQLAMHTNETDFISLCSNAPAPFSPTAILTQEQIKIIAPAIHKTYREVGRNEGWITPETDKDFRYLSEFLKSSNRAAATRMLSSLAIIGLTLTKGYASTTKEEAVKQYLEYYLMVLSEAEHDGWMAWHFARGWRYSPVRNNDECLHNCLLPFSKLSDKDKDKDRDTIRHYPDFARMADMKIEFKK